MRDYLYGGFKLFKTKTPIDTVKKVSKLYLDETLIEYVKPSYRKDLKARMENIPIGDGKTLAGMNFKTNALLKK